MHKSRLTDLSIRALKPPEKGNVVAWDDLVSGFGVRVSQGGTKSFFVLYGRHRARKQIGRVGVIPLSAARDAAKRFLAERTLGQNHDTPSPTFRDAVKEFLETQDHLRPSTKRDYKRLLTNRFQKKLGRLRLSEIETQQIAEILDGLAGKVGERKYAHSVIRRFFQWAISRKHVKSSPLDGYETPKTPNDRERVLSEDELKAAWKAAEATPGPFGVIVRLAIITGQRRSQLSNIRGEWLDRDAKTIDWPSAAVKQKRPHAIPYGDLAASLLPKGNGLLFPGKKKGKPIGGWSKPTAALIKAAGVKHFVLHDLRRTCSTMWSKLRIDRDIREFLLGHRLDGVEGVYDLYDRMPEMRDAVERWERKLIELLSS